MSSHALAPLMRPRSIAVLGASPRANTLGNNAVVNLQRFGYSGRISPVHPSASEVAGLPAFPSLASLPEAPDCAVVALSADKVADALEQAARRGVRAAVVFASGNVTERISLYSSSVPDSLTGGALAVVSHARFIRTPEFHGVWVLETDRSGNLPRLNIANASGPYLVTGS